MVWPTTAPLFDPKAEAWGSTYVVIVCTAMFTVFIWLADLFLHFGITEFLFAKILFPST